MATSDALQHLAIEIDGEIEHFRQLRRQVNHTTERLASLAEPEIYDLRSVAMLLTEIYLGAENLMRRVAKRLVEPIPTGDAWHQQLLAQFSAEAPGLRPALFTSAASTLLDEFRRFRHVTHHVYAIEFDWEQMSKLIAASDSLLAQIITDASTLKAFLASASEDQA